MMPDELFIAVYLLAKPNQKLIQPNAIIKSEKTLHRYILISINGNYSATGGPF